MHAKMIVVIEDNVGDIVLLKYAFTQANIVCDWKIINDGRSALQWIADISADQRPNLIILDLNLPCYSGWDILSEIKQQPILDKTHVTIFSSSTLPTDNLKASKENVSFLTKPMGVDEYVNIVRVMANRLVEEELTAV